MHALLRRKLLRVQDSRESINPNKCSRMVTTSHSMAVIPTIIAAGLYATEQEKGDQKYPWAGMVLSALGEVPTATMLQHASKGTMWSIRDEDVPPGNDPNIHVGPFTRENKLALMLGPSGTCDPDLDALLWKQNSPFLTAELTDLNSMWIQRSDHGVSTFCVR